MRKIEKETLQIINSYKSEEYSHYKKLIDIRKKELEENLQKDLENFVLKEQIEKQIENFKNSFDFNISINFELSIRSYYTDYESLYNNDEIIKENFHKMQCIESERNRMKLILQNSDIKSEEYQAVIRNLKKG